MLNLKIPFIWIIVILSSYLVLIKSIVVVPPTAITYQPPHIQSRQFKFSLTSGYIVSANMGGSDYFATHQILFQRIHLNQVKNYKLTLSMAGLNYNSPVQGTSLSALVLFEWRALNDTGFLLDATVTFVNKFAFMNCRYLAVNDIDGTEFYFDQGKHTSSITLSSTPSSIFQPYPFSSLQTQYSFFIIMRGIDIYTTISNTYYIWTSKVYNHDGTKCRIQFTGTRAILKQVYFTIVYTKKILQHTDPYSKVFQTKIVSIKNHACSAPPGFGGCISYNSNTHKPAFKIFSNNYFLGINDFGAEKRIDYYIQMNLGTLDVWLPSYSGVRQDGILFFAIICPVGFSADIPNNICIQCGNDCIQCNSKQCQICKANYYMDQDKINCLPLFPNPKNIKGCDIYSEEDDGQYSCILCNTTQRLSLISQTLGCACRDHYFMNLTSNACQQICGDGIKVESQCDDNNTKDNDGCDSQCKLQPGFLCDVTQNPTQCNTSQELVYQIKSIIKTDNNNKPSGIIVLRPSYNKLPFDVIKNNFYTYNTQLSQIDLKLVMNESSGEVLKDLEFDLLKVENNEIWLMFHYNFTVEDMTAQIVLNYSETRYFNKTQTLNITLKGENDAFKISEFQAAYNTVSNNVIVTVVLSMAGLVIGLFVRKFVGLEMIITIQLIFYSQLLIYDFDKWPVGFVQFNDFKAATGYNEFFNLTQYTPMTVVSKKYNKLALHKTIIENFNLNFVVLLVIATVFYMTVFLRSSQENRMKDFVRHNKIMDGWQNTELTEMSKTHKKLTKINDVLYWVNSQLSLWCLLPLLSTLGAQFLIPNNLVQVNDDAFTSLLLKLRPSEFMVSISVIVTIGFNHFKNMMLSTRTVRKIQERPQEQLYKKLLFVYLPVMSLLVFFYNDVKIHTIPMSVVCLVVHTFYIVLLIIIRPYKQALRIHSVALYFNQSLYWVFLVVINLINLIDVIDDFLVLCFGYFLIGCVYLLILLTVVRLYYEIRYGQALQNKIQIERKKEEEKQKVRQEEKMKQNAEKKLDETQKIRDLNKFLIENQMKETEQINLLEWLQHKNWEKQTKEQYFYNKHTEKPLEWMRKKDKAEYEKRVNAMKECQGEAMRKKQKKEEDPEYINLMKRMRENLEEKKNKKKTQKVMRKQKTKQNFYNDN